MKTSKTKNAVGFGKILLISIGALLAVLLITAVIVGALVFGKEHFFETPLQPGDIALQTGIVNRILPDALQSNDPNATARVKLTPDEINALIRVVSNAENIMQMFGMQGNRREEPVSGANYRAVYTQGKFSIDYSVDTDWWTPFGSHILIHTVFVPTLREQKITLQLDTLYVGGLPVMAGATERALEPALARLLKNEDMEQLHEIVHELYIDQQHNLVIVYYPTKLKDFLLSEVISRITRQ